MAPHALFDKRRVGDIRKALADGKPYAGNKQSQPLSEPIAQSIANEGGEPKAPTMAHGWRASKPGEHPGQFTLRPGMPVSPEAEAFLCGISANPVKPDLAPDDPEYTSKPWTRAFCALYNAMRVRDLDGMQKAIDSGANVNSRFAVNLSSSDREEDKNLAVWTPLRMAWSWRFYDVVGLLLKNGAKM